MKKVLIRIAVLAVAVCLALVLQSLFFSGGSGPQRPVLATAAPLNTTLPMATVVPLAAAPGAAPAYDAAALAGWSGVMDIPSADEIAGFQATDRSPYIACWPTFDNCAGFTEIAVDFQADLLPPGTYVCVCQFDLDMSELQSQYANVYRDYNGVAGYAGFQVLEDGTHVAILSLWDTYCVDAAGNTTTLRAQLLYPEPDANDSFGGEGTGAHCLVPYDWKAGHSYRMMLKEGTLVSDGKCAIALSVCDLETGEWTELAYYSTGVNYTYMKDPCSFLENFTTETAGEVRSVRWSNYRVLDAGTGAWVPASSAYIQKYTGTGSYTFGADADSFWAVTTGLPGRCAAPADGVYSVSNCAAGSPY